MPEVPQDLSRFQAFVEIVAALRGPNGCPWDKEQTHQSLTPYALEESFELVDAIDRGDDQHIQEELGDVLLQVVLHAQVARDRGAFGIEDVIRGIGEKMVRRHPHVFAQAKVKNAAEVTARWDEIKRKEKQGADAAENPTENPFAGIPTALPALLRSQKIGHKSIRYNFDWSRVEDVIAKVEEELGELKDAIRDAEPREAVELEVGDLLFSVTQLARHLGLDAEQALRKTNRKFEKRFVKMQELVAADGKDFKALTVDGLEEFWKRAKAFDGA